MFLQGDGSSFVVLCSAFLSVFVGYGLRVVVRVVSALFGRELSVGFACRFPSVAKCVRGDNACGGPHHVDKLHLKRGEATIRGHFPLSLSHHSRSGSVSCFAISAGRGVSLFSRRITSLNYDFIGKGTTLLFTSFALSARRVGGHLASLFNGPIGIGSIFL